MAEFDDSPEESLVNEAEELMRQGRYQDAVGRYEELCNVAPSDVMAKLGYASALECAGDVQQAEQVVNDIATNHATNLNVRRFQHLFFERREDYNRAMLCQEVLKEHSSSISDGPLDQLADLYFNQGRYHEALKELERIQRDEQIEDETFLASILGRIGACHRQAGKNTTALEFLEGALDHEPENHWLLTEIAEAERAEEHMEEARLAYERALEIMPQDHFARSRLAQLEVEENNIEKSIELYEEILNEQPKAHWAMVELAQVLSQVDQDRSQQLCEEALDIDPTYPIAYSHLGQLARNNNQLEEARKYYQEALHNMPNANWILHELADIAHQLGRQGEAQTHLDRALSNDPFDPISYGVQADFLRQKNKLTEAVAYLRKAVELDNEYNWAWRELAEIQALQGKHDEADVAGNHYYNLEQNQAYSDGLKAFLLRQRNQTEASLPYLERAVAEQPDYFWAWRELIEHYLQNEQLAAAEQKAQQASSHISGNPTLLGLLAESQRQQRKYTHALESIDEAIQNNEAIPQLWALKAEILLHSDIEQAINCAKRARELDDSSDYQILYAQCLLHNDYVDDAQRIVIDVIEQDKHDAYLYDMATDISLRQGDQNAAALWADRGLSHHPEHRRLLLRRAQIAVERKEDQGADLLQAAAEASGQKSWREFIIPSAKLGDMNNARRFAYLAIEQYNDQATDCARIWMTLAEAELIHKNTDDAKYALEQSLKSEDAYLPAHLLIGMLAEQERDFDKAEFHLRTVFNACNDEEQITDIDKQLLLRQLAHIEEERHHHESAAEYLRLLQDLNDHDAASQIDMAAFELRHGNQKNAEQSLLALLDDHDIDQQQFQRAIHNLAWYYLQRDSAADAHEWICTHREQLDDQGLALAAQLALAHGAFEAAQQHIENIPKRLLQDQHRRILCRAYIGQSRYYEAESHIRPLWEQDTTHEENAILLGECLSYQGAFEDALDVLRHPQLPLVASDERLFLVACLLLEIYDIEHCLTWLGHKPAKMVNNQSLKRVFQAAFTGAWFDRDTSPASDNDILSLPPFPRALSKIADAMCKQHHHILGSQVLVLAHNICLERDELIEAQTIAKRIARLLKSIKQHQLARRYAFQSGSVLMKLRYLFPF